MARAKSEKTYKHIILGHTVHRIDGRNKTEVVPHSAAIELGPFWLDVALHVPNAAHRNAALSLGRLDVEADPRVSVRVDYSKGRITLAPRVELSFNAAHDLVARAARSIHAALKVYGYFCMTRAVEGFLEVG